MKLRGWQIVDQVAHQRRLIERQRRNDAEAELAARQRRNPKPEHPTVRRTSYGHPASMDDHLWYEHRDTGWDWPINMEDDLEETTEVYALRWLEDQKP